MANRFFLAFLAKLLSFHLRIVDLTQAVTYILAEYTRACENWTDRVIASNLALNAVSGSVIDENSTNRNQRDAQPLCRVERVNRIPVSTYLSPRPIKIENRSPLRETHRTFSNFRANSPDGLSTWTANRDKRLSWRYRSSIERPVSFRTEEIDRKKYTKTLSNKSFPPSRATDLDRRRLYSDRSTDTSWCATYVTDASVSLLCHNRGSWSRSSCRSIKHASL